MKNLFPSNLFMWGNPARTASAEISELVGNGHVFDPNNITVSIESTRTGNIQRFLFSSYDLDASGEDIVGLRYVSEINGELWTLLIIND